MADAEDDGNSSDENGLYIKEDDDEDIKQENISQNSSDGNDTRLSDLHNTTIKSEESDEDVPLVIILFINLSFKRFSIFFYFFIFFIITVIVFF